jgi:hypothetical protein
VGVFFTTAGDDDWPLVMLRLAKVDVRRLAELATDPWHLRAPVTPISEPGPVGHPTETSAASGYVCPVDDAAELFVVGVVVAPDDVPADHAGLFLVAGVVGAVEREIPQRRELGFYAV